MKVRKHIYGIGLALTCGLAATLKGQDLYVVNSGSQGFPIDNPTIGEYGLDGSTVNASLIGVLGNPWGIAISGDDLFFQNGNSGFIEYTTSGTEVIGSSVPGAPISGIAISGNDLFVANASAGTIGEYGLDGSTVNASLISGLDNPAGIAILGNDLFIANAGNGTIGEYGLDGSTVNVSLISGLDNPAGIVISPAPEPSAVSLAGVGAAALCLWRRRRYETGA